MRIIRQWLSGPRNFTAGAILYKSLGTNKALKNLLERGETSFAKNLLAEELEKLANTGVEVISLEKPLAKETTEMPDSSNNVLQAIKNEWMPLYQRMNFLRHQLDKDFEDMNSPEAIAYRKPIAAEILQIEKQCKQHWSTRDHYQKHGKLPFVAQTKITIPTDPVELATLISNIKNYIRRYRKKMEEKPGEPRYAQMYNDYKLKHKEVTGKEYEEKD